MIYKLYLLLFLFVFNFSIVIAQTYSISGNVTGFNDNIKVSLVDNDLESKINHTTLKKGHFYLNGTLKNGPMYLTVVLHDEGKEYDCTVFVGNGKVQIKGSKKDFPYDIEVIGSTEQSKYNAYRNMLKDLNISLDQKMQVYIKAKEKGDSIAALKAAIAYNAVGTEFRSISKKWVLNNTDTYYGINELHDLLFQLNRDTIQNIYASLSPQLKKSIYGKRIYTYLTIGDTLKINDRYFDFEAFDITGKNQQLSTLDDKYILLDFSSIHCGPCEESIEELRMLSHKYANQLRIVSFTSDNHADWLQGIKKDHITWISLSDGEGSYSKTLLKYGGQTIPKFYLISPDGIIKDKWDSYEKLSSGTGEIEKRILKYLKAQQE